jgi:glycogen debranching enzyme
MDRRKFIGISPAFIAAFGFKGFVHDDETEKKFITNNSSNEWPVFLYPEFNLYKIPFSYVGSYHTINHKGTGTHRLSINTVRRSVIPYKWQSSWSFNLMDITLWQHGNEIAYETIASPWSLELKAANGAGAAIVFADADTMAINVTDCSVKLIPYRNFSWAYNFQHDELTVYDEQANHYYSFRNSNNTSLKLLHDLSNNDGVNDAIEHNAGTLFIRMITEEEHAMPAYHSFDMLLEQRKAEVDTWMQQNPCTTVATIQNAANIGWYLFWNLQVKPWRNYTRQTVLSSKRSMNMIWSWDICFNALALVKANHKLAWDQLFAILDKQKNNGLLPDTVSDLENRFGFNKPPVWGWTIMKMLKQTPKDHWHNYINEAYNKVGKFTQWWLQNRQIGPDGLCAYLHGNDSGWDNATLFDEKLPVQSPDLTAYLILQAEALAFMADYLGKKSEADAWMKLAAEQLSLFNKYFITEDGFVYRTVLADGTVQSHTSTSLLTRIPLLLGKRLPEATRKKVTDELKTEGVFLTPVGLASEALTSTEYESNGYWRGPVWSPSTYLLFDGLLECGETAFAQNIAERYCTAVAKTATFDENYDAQTGKGQYDSGLTWTASDFLIMAGWLGQQR